MSTFWPKAIIDITTLVFHRQVRMHSFAKGYANCFFAIRPCNVRAAAACSPNPWLLQVLKAMVALGALLLQDVPMVTLQLFMSAFASACVCIPA